MMMRYGFAALIAMVLAVACGTDDEATFKNGASETCTAGEITKCACPDGSDGSQLCKNDGSGYFPCFCENPPDDDGGGGSSTSAGGGGAGAAGQGGGGMMMVGLPPTAGLGHPGDNETRQVNVNIPFDGSGIDAEDGVLGGPALVWTSDVQGDLGTGVSISAALTTTGTHLITLTVTDSDGNTDAESITLNIVP